MPNYNPIFQYGSNKGQVKDTKTGDRGEVGCITFNKTLRALPIKLIIWNSKEREIDTKVIDEGDAVDLINSERVGVRDRSKFARNGHNLAFVGIKSNVQLFCPVREDV